MGKDEFQITYWWIIIILILYGLLYCVLVVCFSNQIFTLSITMLSTIPSLVLVIATVMYVRATVKILNENTLERKKSFIKDLVVGFLIPIRSILDDEVKSFASDYFIHLNERKYEALENFHLKDRVFFDNKEINYKIFTEQYPDLSEKVKIHDEEKIPKLQGVVSKFINTIYTDKFKNEWEHKLHFGQKGERDFHGKQTMLDRFLESIIHGNKCALGSSIWDKYEKEILQLRYNYKVEIDSIYKKREEINDSANNLKKELTELIKSELITYGILPDFVKY